MKALQEYLMEHRLVVAYVTSGPPSTDSQIPQAIEALGEWIQIDDSAYLLWTNCSPEEVRRRVGEVMPSGDRLAVIDADTMLARDAGGSNRQNTHRQKPLRATAA